MPPPDLPIVWTCGNRLEADLAKCTLEAAGIRAMVQADTAGGMREHLAWSGEGFKILVREEDAAAAHDVLASSVGSFLEEGDDLYLDADDRPSWRRFT